jgi:hypothetical protein
MLPFSPYYSYSFAWFSPIFQLNFDFSIPEDKINVWPQTVATKHPVMLRCIAEVRKPHLHHQESLKTSALYKTDVIDIVIR